MIADPKAIKSKEFQFLIGILILIYLLILLYFSFFVKSTNIVCLSLNLGIRIGFAYVYKKINYCRTPVVFTLLEVDDKNFNKRVKINFNPFERR